MRRRAPPTASAPLVALLWVVAGCRPTPSTESRAAAADLPVRLAPAHGQPPDAGGPVALLRARCSPSRSSRVGDGGEGGGRFASGAGPGADDLEIGDGVLSRGLFAVGLVRETRGGRVASLAWVDPSGAAPTRLLDLGLTLGDAPPPRVAARGDELQAAAYTTAGAAERATSFRQMTVYRIQGSGDGAAALASVAQQSDESLAFDFVAASAAGHTSALVWDEVSALGRRGVIRAAAFGVGMPAPTAHDVSPSGSDAELPRLAAMGSGFIALWLARESDDGGRSDDPRGARTPVAEVPGETRDFGWLEAVALDERAMPVGPVRRLTPAGGHISAFDVVALPGGDSLVAIARDDGETVDGSGGALVRVRLVGDRVEGPVQLATDGLGRGGPELIDGRPPWLAWVGPHERLRLMPLDETGAAAAPPSAEEDMNDARPLVVLPDDVVAAGGPGGQGQQGQQGQEGHGALLLAASPWDDAGAFREFSCAR